MYAKSHSSLYQVTMVSLKDKHQDADKIMSQLNKDLNLAKNQKLYSFGLLTNKTDGLIIVIVTESNRKNTINHKSNKNDRDKHKKCFCFIF